MAHETTPEAEALLDKEIKVLNHGFVRLIDYMGNDKRIAQAARVSYGEGTKTISDDKILIDYLLRHQHTSPFEHVVLELHCKMPIFVARQWIRHRMARINEISGRYSIMTDEFYLPPEEEIKGQSVDKKQSRSLHELPADKRKKVLEILKRDQGSAYASYKEMIDDGIARELARINLPLSLYTQWYWQMDLHNLIHFLELRMDSHAQWEIRQYANAIAGIVKTICPIAYEAFERHRLDGKHFSAEEIGVIKGLLDGKPNPLEGLKRKEFDEKLFGKVY
jgi:thymidylate synthase (FAD)